MPSPLNPTLFGRLREEFGRVQVSHAGIAASFRYGPDPIDNRMKMQMSPGGAGEYYRVNCPYCNDSRSRLWVNHIWGVPDEMDNKNLWLAICYNEDCLSHKGRSGEFYDRVYGFKNVNQRGQKIVVLQGEVESQVLTPKSLPGMTLSMDRVPESDKSVLYLRSRGLDPKYLAKTFDIGLCLDAFGDYPMAHGRIVIPIVMRGILVGWQCRYVGDVDWKARGIPKYYNLPNMPRRLMLYNFDVARKFPYVVVTEGPLDAWAVGEPAVAAFGKHLSVSQRQLLRENWENGVVIVLLDGDAWADAQKLTELLRQEHYSGVVVPVRLPDGRDPGATDTSLLWQCINDACHEVGIDLMTLTRSEKNEHSVKSGLSYRAPRSNDEQQRDVEPEGSVSGYAFDVPRSAGTGA